MHVHAIGDRAVTETLNAFAYMRQSNGSNDIAHSITHLQVVIPADFKRFSHLKIIANMQLLWANADSYVVDLVKPYLDPSTLSSSISCSVIVKGWGYNFWLKRLACQLGKPVRSNSHGRNTGWTKRCS